MMTAKPTCPEGYYLYYHKAQGKFTMVWLMAGKLGEANKDNKLDRKVALIQEMDDGGTYLAFLTAREGERAMQNDDPQELIVAVCAIDRMTLSGS